MATALDIIQDSLELLGVYAPGEVISDADSTRALFVLNAMLDELAAENIFVYALNTVTVTLASGTATYSISPRPDRVTLGPAAASVTVGATTSPVNVVSSIEYQALAAANANPATPDTLWYSPSYPAGTVSVLPAPNAAGTLILTAWQRIVSFPKLSTEFTLAPGVLDGLRANLAVSAKAYFTGSQIDPLVLQSAIVSRDFLRYQGQTSRAMFSRFVLSTNPQKAP